MTESTEPRTAALTAPSETFLAVAAKTIGRHGHGIDLWNALHDAGLTITPTEPGRVVIERDRIGYDEGYEAFKRFVREQYRPDWEPGDWQVIAEATWAAIDAAIAAAAERAATGGA